MDIAVVGAGFAGLATAKHLNAIGHRVTVFEKAPDVGGVWSSIRRYPGISTQSPKGSYFLHDLRMPASYPERPAGEQVQAYLESYVEKFSLGSCLHLNTEVIAASPIDGGWDVVTRATDGLGRTVPNAPTTKHTFEYLVVCNGAFSIPSVPDFQGKAAFEAAGGKIYHSSEFLNPKGTRGKDVLVVGYGKSACDVAYAVSELAKSTTVIARTVLWKIPTMLGGVLNYKYALNTRASEALTKYAEGSLTYLEWALHTTYGLPLRNALMGGLGILIQKQLGLAHVGLVPRSKVDTVASAHISMVTDGFFEKVASSEIAVKRECEIEALVVEPSGHTSARLSDGSTLPADIIVCGTGFHQQPSFLSPDIIARCTDARGNWALYRHILPPDVPRLAFVGYNGTLFCAMSAEMGSLWLAGLLDGLVALPSQAEQHKRIEAKIAFLENRGLPHARATCIVPWSMHTMDELLGDLGTQISPLEVAKQYVTPIDAGAYAGVEQRLLARKERKHGGKTFF